MFLFFLGTQSGIIKMSQVIKKFQTKKIPIVLVCSGQHVDYITPLLRFFDLPNPTFHTSEDVKSSIGASIWWVKSFVLMPKLLKLSPRNSTVIVHGDCLSAFMGSVIARILYRKLVHVEAGGRTTSFFDPYPEMFCRVLIDHVADVLFAPSKVEYNHLIKEGVKGKIINTKANTVLDAMRFTLGKSKTRNNREPYAVCTIHRFETLHSSMKLGKVLRFLRLISNDVKVYFFGHRSTTALCAKLKGMNVENILVKPLLPYPEFLTLVNNSEFVVTDSGGLQHEAYYMGKPCLVMRNRIEINEGLGENTILSRFQEEKVRQFLRNYKQYKIEKPIINNATYQPSEMIVNELT